MKQQVFISESVNDLEKVAKALLTFCQDEKIIAFYGELGAGKTTLIKEICKQLGVIDEVNSPSFTLVNEYEFLVDNQNKEVIYHFDFYRIKDERELYDLGYEDYFYSGNYCFIEWPERFINLFPTNFVKVIFAEKNNKTTITFNINL